MINMELLLLLIYVNGTLKRESGEKAQERHLGMGFLTFYNDQKRKYILDY